MRILQQLIGAYLVSCLAAATLMMAASLGLSPGGDNSLLLITSGAFFCGALCCALCGDTNRRGHNLRGALPASFFAGAGALVALVCAVTLNLAASAIDPGSAATRTTVTNLTRAMALFVPAGVAAGLAYGGLPTAIAQLTTPSSFQGIPRTDGNSFPDTNVMMAVTATLGGVMFELNSQIAHLELRCEQLIIHLRTSDRNSEDALVHKADLYSLLKELARLKRKRERSLDIPRAA